MKRTILAATALVACAAPVQSYRATAPTPPGDTYTCAVRHLQTNGYALLNTDRESGFIRAEKQDSGFGAAMAGEAYFTVITATIVEQGAVADIQAQVARRRGNGSSTGLSLTDGHREEARALLSACGSGEIEAVGD